MKIQDITNFGIRKLKQYLGGRLRIQCLYQEGKRS